MDDLQSEVLELEVRVFFNLIDTINNNVYKITD